MKAPEITAWYGNSRTPLASSPRPPLHEFLPYFFVS